MAYTPLVRVRRRAVAGPLWSALRAAAEPLSISELHIASRAHPNAIQLRLKRWQRAGLVEVVPSNPRRFTMLAGAPKLPPTVNRAGVAGPPSTMQDRLWRAMRVMRRFTLPELIMAARSTRRSAETFVNALLRAGYLRNIARGNARTGTWSVYVLARGGGVLTPSIRHRRCADTGCLLKHLFDPNSGLSTDIGAGTSANRARAVNHVR